MLSGRKAAFGAVTAGILLSAAVVPYIASARERVVGDVALTTAAAPRPDQTRSERVSAFVDRLADKLDVSEDELRGAIRQTVTESRQGINTAASLSTRERARAFLDAVADKLDVETSDLIEAVKDSVQNSEIRQRFSQLVD